MGRGCGRRRRRPADLLQPLFHASAAAAAIVLFTALVRLLVHPLSRATARGQRARAELQPRIAELREKHAKEKVSPLSGCLPGLLQLPAFFLLCHLFSNASIGGASNALLTHSLPVSRGTARGPWSGGW